MNSLPARKAALARSKEEALISQKTFVPVKNARARKRASVQLVKNLAANNRRKLAVQKRRLRKIKSKKT
jgi:hypothetical protein